MPEIITIKNELLSLELAPDCGGAIRAFRGIRGAEAIDLMRPASVEALQEKDPLLTACFPLVPFSNRIERGQFSYGSRRVNLDSNMAPHPHPLHGQGWRHPWKVVERTEKAATLAYHHQEGDDGWPWSYRAQQHFLLEKSTMKVALSIQNNSDEAFPVGLGLHPYFPRTTDVKLETELAVIWNSDDDCIPYGTSPASGHLDFENGRTLNGLVLDHCFSGWNRQALIRWPSKKLQMTLSAQDCLNHCVLFVPEGEDFFCLEPVSNVTNAFNMKDRDAGNTGYRSLPSGRTFHVSVQFEVYGLTGASFLSNSSERGV